ncbi:MAG: glycerol-3-phosphate 1-O-acyltransferase PlsY [Gammaproteobacteria bacterium]|nr:glycerol-3-phosphate 1-O-acyltransferase PlsY [Gammaproteobacteria bacterium]
MTAALYVIASYLIGSLSAAILVSRALGKGDPRAVGSGNPGATNVLRSFGKFAAAATLIGDVTKGVVPVLVAWKFGLPMLVIAGAGLAAFAGHLYPIFFGFRGGKGVATQIGVLTGFDWRLGVTFIATWLIVASITRYSSLAALTATLLAPLVAVALKLPSPLIGGAVVIVVAVFWRHRANIGRLLNGTESRIGKSRA